MKSFFDNRNLLIIIGKWKVHLILMGLITIVSATIFTSSFFITPLYQSQARVYPTNTTPYSKESESEQMLEFFNSTDIKRQIIEVFDLPRRYKIKNDDPYFRTKILKKYNNRINCKKTEYESLEIKALDADPEVASRIVDSLIVFYDRKVLELNRYKAREAAGSYEQDLERKKTEIASVAVKMESLRKTFGLLDYEIQTEQVTRGYLTALAGSAGSKAVSDIKQLLNNLEEKGGEYFLLQREIKALENQRDTINQMLDKALSVMNKQETYTMIVEEPFPADKKTYPVRWLILLVSLIAAEFVALVTIFSMEGLKSSKP